MARKNRKAAPEKAGAAESPAGIGESPASSAGNGSASAESPAKIGESPAKIAEKPAEALGNPTEITEVGTGVAPKSASPTGEGEKASVESTAVTLPVVLLHPAKWNPRPKITSESVADIRESLKTVGLIQPLAVWKDAEGDGYTILAGHRRFKACLDAGWTAIPCSVKKCDEREARQITFFENLQRKDPDPVLEARNIQALLDMGLTMPEIAKQAGRSLGWVANRKQLTALTKEWLDILPKVSINVDALERVSRYRPESQREAFKELKPSLVDWGKHNETVRWADIKYQFTRIESLLDSAPFDVRDCKSCPKNSLCAPLLFPDLAEKGGKSGVCLDSVCFARKANEAASRAIEKHKSQGRSVVSIRCQYDAPCQSWDMKEKYSSKTPVLYTWKDHGVTIIKFGPSGKKAAAEKKAPTPEEKREKQRKKNLKLARAALWQWMQGHFETFLSEMVCRGAEERVNMLTLAAVIYAIGPDNKYLIKGNYDRNSPKYDGYKTPFEEEIANACRLATDLSVAQPPSLAWPEVWEYVKNMFLDETAVMRGGLDGIWTLWRSTLGSKVIHEDVEAAFADYDKYLGITEGEAE